MDTKAQLSFTSRFLHWIIAVTLLGMIAAGFYMSNFEVWALYSIHKSIGVIIFGFILARVIWRLKNGWPESVRAYPKWEHGLAVVIHWLLLIGSVVMPISGMIYSGFSGHGFGVFGLSIVSAQYTAAGEVIPVNESLSEIGHEIHELAAFILVAAIILHVAGALKHHIIDKDRTLLRMLGKSE